MNMTELPNSLEDAVVQAQASTIAALEAGYPRVAIELLFPELKAMPVARQFVTAFESYGAGLKIFFTDAGTAAWAKRDWAGLACKFGSLDVAGSRQTTTVEEQIEAEDQIYIFVSPTAVEIGPVEQICNAAGDRPVILLNPRLEDVAIIGIGYAARQIRDRFINTIEPCYYLRPLDDTLALTRMYPAPWQLWVEAEGGGGGGDWRPVAEALQKPDSEELENLIAQATGKPTTKGGFLGGLSEFIRALSR
jgi:Domain of unknown function (DUF1995)